MQKKNYEILSDQQVSLGNSFHICSLGFLVICLVKTTPEAEEIVILREVVGALLEKQDSLSLL